MAATAVPRAETHTFGGLVATVAALASAGAGIVHLDAAGDHADHEVLAAAFVAMAVAQLWWAGSAVAGPDRRRVFAVGVVLHGSALAVWCLSRTVGLPDVADGIGGVEPLGWSDVAASVLELTTLAVIGLTLAMPAGAAGARLSAGLGPRLLRGTAAVTLLATVSAVLAPHAHGGDDGHGHGDAELAGHAHDAGEGHPLAEVVHGHAGAATTGAEDHAEHLDGHAPAAEVAHASHAAGDAHAEHTAGSTSVGAQHGDHAEHAEHAEHAPHVESATASPPVDPLAGPGQVSTLRVGPIPLLPSIPGVDIPHLPAALPYAGPGRLNLLPLTGLPAPCEDCYVLGIQPDLVYADGSSANLDTGPMLHHAVFTDHSRDDPVCGRDTLLGQMGLRVFAAGNERTGGVLPEGFGVPVGGGPFGGIVELMNTSTQLRMVYIQLAVRWVPRSTPGVLPVTPVWLDVDSCSDSEVDVPAGVSDVVWQWPSSLTGRIVAAGGHLHDGGVWLRLTNESTDEHVCTSVAGYGARPAYLGTLDSMSTCAWDRLGTVRAGEVLNLTARYNTTAPASGVMGIMLAFVHETDDLGAGSPSPYPSEPPPDGAPPGAGHHH